MPDLTGAARGRWEQKIRVACPDLRDWELDIIWHGRDYPPVVLQAELVVAAAWRRGA